MQLPLPSLELIQAIEASEIDYMSDRMRAIQSRPDNPEGIEVVQFGGATCYYSKTMPWPGFNTVKGVTSQEMDVIKPIIEFYRARERKVQFEIVPSLVDQNLLKQLAACGLYQSGFHTSLYCEPTKSLEKGHNATRMENQQPIVIQELQEDQFELYATIHCRGTGLSNDGIPHVASNNKVLYSRPGWKFYLAYVKETPAAVGVCFTKHGRASLTFAATLPEYRRLGLQQSLLTKRIEEAALNDCKLVVGQCAFLSQSHRNMERVGMRIGYIRTSWSERE